MTTIARLGHLDDMLSPKQRVLAWILEWRESQTPGEYMRRRFGDINALTVRLEQVRETVKRKHRGKPRDEVEARVKAAAQEFIFLDELVELVNARMTEQFLKVSYFPLLLCYTPKERKQDMCLLTCYEIMGEIALLKRISDVYFDGQQITYDGAMEALQLAEHAWWLALQDSGDVDKFPDADFVQEFVSEYVDHFVRSIVSVATVETHAFFGRDVEARNLRMSLVAWAYDTLTPPRAEA